MDFLPYFLTKKNPEPVPLFLVELLWIHFQRSLKSRTPFATQTTKGNERLLRARQMPAGSDTSCNPYFLPLCCLLPEAILDYSLDLLDLKSANILFAK